MPDLARDLLGRLAAAWRFLTVLPFFRPAGPGEAEALKRSALMFPVVGVIIGGVMALMVWGLGAVFPVLVVAALALAALVKVSMGLHLDGVADCGDGLMSMGRGRDRVLEIMKDSRVGAHGVMAVALVLILKFACLSSAGNGMGQWGMAFMMPLCGRAGMLWAMGLLPYARAEGLGKAITAGWREIVFGTVAVGVGFFCFGGWALLGIGLAVWLLLELVWVWYLKRRLGGATGDCYGAACEIGEIAAGLGFLCGDF